MSKGPPLVAITALYATVADWGATGQIHGPLRPGPLVSPNQAHVLLDSGPLVDIRAVATSTFGAFPDRGPEVETRWAVSVLAFYEDDGCQAMDDALAQLHMDIQAGRIAPRAHSGRPWPRNPLEPPAEALLAEFRESYYENLGRP